MNIITRRQFLASSAACGFASAVPSLVAPGAALAATPILLRAESRVIEVGGRAATVYGLVREDGKQGLALQAGENFRVRLENALDAPTLIHWHGLTPPFGQDGVPDAVGTPVVAEQAGHGHGAAEDVPGTDAHGGGGHLDEDAGGALIVGNIGTGPVTTVEVGSHPAHVIADPAGERAFVSNSGDDTITVVDLARGETVGEISTGDYPHGLRISPDGSTIYVANVEDGTVSIIDAVALEETDRIEVGKAPVQVGFTPDGDQVYVSLKDENKVAVIDTATRHVTSRVDVGRSPIQTFATPDGGFVDVANQGTETEPDETVSVIDVASGAVVKTITTGKGAHGVTVSDDGAHVFVTNIVNGTVSEISVATQTLVRTHEVRKGPNGITFHAQ